MNNVKTLLTRLEEQMQQLNTLRESIGASVEEEDSALDIVCREISLGMEHLKDAQKRLKSFV